jgi:hypothetical protein
MSTSSWVVVAEVVVRADRTGGRDVLALIVRTNDRVVLRSARDEPSGASIDLAVSGAEC